MTGSSLVPVGHEVTNLLKLPKLNTVVVDRLLDAAEAIAQRDSEGICYMHSILCQTSLPYRDPGNDVREWERRQGKASLRVEAGVALHPETGEWIKVGLPHGAKSRLLLGYLNTRAIVTQNRVVEIGDSLTDFVTRELKLGNYGRNMVGVKEQMTRLAACSMRFGYTDGETSYNTKLDVVKDFDLWFSKDERQKVLWPSVVVLSADYFENLLSHAVPLEMRAMAALSHSAMGLDIYTWLAQRLHRIDRGKRQMIAWPVVKEQFGADIASLTKFRQNFMVALRQVCAVYPSARIDVTRHGVFLYNSLPPISKTGVVLSLSTENN